MDVFRQALNEYALPRIKAALAKFQTQKAFADDIGTSQQSVSAWMRGHFPPKEIPMLAVITGKRVGDVLYELAAACNDLEPRPPRPIRHAKYPHQ